MASINKVTLFGRLGDDPEICDTANGKIVNLRLATSESWTDKSSGERKERTQWHSVAIFNENTATVAANYLKKGSQVIVEGALEYRSYTDKNGVEKMATEIVISRFRGDLTLVDPRSDSKGGSNGRTSFSDDLPF